MTVLEPPTSQAIDMDEPRNADESAEGAEEQEIYLLSRGWLVDFLTRLPTPVFAMPGRSLYRHFVHGHGFSLAVGRAKPSIGFYTTVFTAATSFQEARLKAIARTRARWNSFYPEAEGDLFVELEETEPLRERFKLRSALGLVLFSEYDDEDPQDPDA